MRPTACKVTSAYERLGGEAAVAAAVALLFDRVTSDPVLAPCLEGVDPRRLREHQRELLTAGLGGTPTGPQRSLRGAHAPPAVTGAGLDRAVEHLTVALARLGLGAQPAGDTWSPPTPVQEDAVSHRP